ncbi:MAG: fumarylacetoacetase [Tateyamaria sp.]|jgi:fumarylacetoacetase|uniref:fumarylacetoacetase n=1 Tax=Tateyamaria sp. TaxID=1929288 RepID=UPI0032DCA011
MPLKRSWISSANTADTDFPLNNLPYGVFSTPALDARCGVAIGDMIFDMQAAEEQGVIDLTDEPLFDVPFWNELMEQGPAVWTALRNRLTDLLAESARDRAMVEPLMVPMGEATLHMPLVVSEYTDFYAGRHHATNVGTMFRGPENALPPNWLHMPIGYNGRASSVVVSGTDIRRPWGQLKSPDHDVPAYLPSRRFDLELEMGAIVGTSSSGPLTVDQADAAIFGYVLLNDWSARDIQAWEYQPLGPFQAKATATSISPWIVTKAALDPFRTSTPPREVPLLDHLKDTGPMLYDIDLSVTLAPADKPATMIAQTNYKEMYYSSAQQLAHHATSGCPMNAGDLLGSGTISGPTKSERGSLLELSWGGKEPLSLDSGDTRTFLEDGDTLTLAGHANGDGYKIGFGTCTGTIIPALKAT